MGLGHTHASFLIFKGIDIVYISHRLGHANISVTLKTYAHLLKDHEEQEENKTIEFLETMWQHFDNENHLNPCNAWLV